MSEKNGSPPHLAATAEGGESKQPEPTRQRARQATKSEPTSMHHKKPTQERSERLPSPRYNDPHGMLDRSLQAQLGRQLRAIYSDVAEEPVPDRFIRLLEELEASEKSEEMEESEESEEKH